MTQVQITQNGTANLDGKAWGYRVSYSRQRADEEYSVRARSLDNHYLLEEKNGRAEQKPFDTFGVENLTDYEKADKRMYDRAKDVAEIVMQRLTPELVDKTARLIGQETKKEKLGKALRKKQLAKQGEK